MRRLDRFLFWLGAGHVWLETYRIQNETRRIRRHVHDDSGCGNFA